MKWSECKKRGIIKESVPDKKRVLSLIETSKQKLFTDSFAPLNENTASTKIVNNYDSLRELLEAAALTRGFKVYNHNCLVGFIQEILKMPSEANRFDKFRKIQNAINYYGEKMSINDAEKFIEEIKELRIKILELLL